METINSKAKGRENVFKCIYCGKYISYNDIDKKKVNSRLIPDTEYTSESNEFWHLKCEKKKKTKIIDN